MRIYMITAAAVLLACGAQAWAIPIIDGGSILNDFEVVGRWIARPGTSGYSNTPALAFAEEGGEGHLYAFARAGSSTYELREFELPQEGPGVVTTSLLKSRSTTNQGLCYDPDYQGGALVSHGTYFSTGWGLIGGTDDDFISQLAGDNDLPMNDGTKTSDWYYYNADMTRIPANCSLAGEAAYVVIRNGGGAPFDALCLLTINTTPSPDIYNIPQLPGRGTGDTDKSVLLDLNAELGVVNPISVEYAYYAQSGKDVLYLLANNASDPYHLIVLTPGVDGVFGTDGLGNCDDVAVGYTFGEPAAGNSYTIEKQHITWENAPGDTTLVGIQGSYSTGFQAVAIDPTTGYIYLHGSGDYGAGVILKDISPRVPEPATIALLGLGFLPLLRRRRR